MALIIRYAWVHLSLNLTVLDYYRSLNFAKNDSSEILIVDVLSKKLMALLGLKGRVGPEDCQPWQTDWLTQCGEVPFWCGKPKINCWGGLGLRPYHAEGVPAVPHVRNTGLVGAGAKLSIQIQHHRSKHWVVVSDTARVTNGKKSFLLSENESTDIPVGVVHALQNPRKVDLELIEVQTVSYLGEDEIVSMKTSMGGVEG